MNVWEEIKKMIVAVVLYLLSLLPLQAQQTTSTFEGRWWLGMLEEAALPLNLTFEAVGDDSLTAVLYSPMQSSDALRATSWSYSDNTLQYANKRLGVKMTLHYNNEDSTFDGTFRQGLMRSEIKMTPTDGIYTLHRPQEPKRPYPYAEEEVRIEQRKADIELTGTLTLPQGDGPFPAVVLVSGSGQQNRDEELLGHKPFLVLADYLTRNGIAVLRYDDRGIVDGHAIGKPNRHITDATTLDFADDAELMIKYLVKHDKIDSRHIGIIGHSEGGVIGPIVAARNPKVAFVVMLGGPGTTGAEILLQQNELIYQLNGVPQRLTDLHCTMLRRFFAAMDTLQPGDYNSYLQKLASELSEGLTKEERKQASLRKADATLMAQQMESAWMRTFIQLDNSHYLKQLDCPVLAIGGEKDCQVPPCNLEAIKKATDGKAETHMMKGLNHLMQHCDTGAPGKYMLIEETMAPEVMELIAHWILSLKKSAN